VSHLSGNPFVFQTDVKSYYASIEHDVNLEQVAGQIDDPQVLELVTQYLRRTVYVDGRYEDVTRGISLGCALSPIMGALFLKPLDDAMAQTGLFYARFMDDWVILAPSRWKLRRVIRIVNQILARLKVQQHPDKTFIGRVARGFDFLGYKIASAGLISVARRTLEKFALRRSQLYEQGASDARIGQYVRRWCSWINRGLDDAWTNSLHAVCDGVLGTLPDQWLREPRA